MSYTLEITVDKEVIHSTYMCGVGVAAGKFPHNAIATISKSCAFAHALRKVFPRAAVPSGRFLLLDAALPHIEVDTTPTMEQFIQDFDEIADVYQSLDPKKMPEDDKEILLDDRLDLLRTFGDGEKAVFQLIIPDSTMEFFLNDEVEQLLKESTHLKLQKDGIQV